MSLKDKYLDLMDWLDAKGIPRIAFFAIIAIIILALVFLVIVPAVSPQNVEVKVAVKDDKGQLIGNQSVEISFGDESFTEKTNLSGNLKAFTVKKGEKVSLTVRRTGFETVSKTITADSEENTVLIVLKKPAALMPKRINLTIAGPDDALLSGKEATIKLSCPVNPSAIAGQESVKTTSEGTLSIEVPLNCGALYADITASGFEEAKGIRLLNAETKVKLSAIEVPKGKVIVKVMNDAEEIISGASFNVALLDSEGIIRSQETSNGTAEFLDVEKTEYHAVVTEDSGMYESAKTETKNLTGTYITLKAKTRRQTKGYLTVKVTNAETGGRIANATIKVLDRQGVVVAALTTDSSNDKNIALFDLGAYALQAFAEDYLPFEKNFDFNSGKITIEARLEKCSESLQNCGKLEARVIDEDNLPVENATVSVYNAETQLLAPIEPKASDANGVAVFTNLKKGSYFLRAIKYPAEKKDSQNSFSIDPKIPARQAVRMEIGRGTIAVIVRDEEGTAIPNALVEFKTNTGKECPKANGDACIIEASIEGIAEFEFKADKKVYAIVSMEGYSSFESAFYQIMKNQVLAVNAELKKEIPGQKPSISLVGVFGTDGVSRKNELRARQRFVVRLKLDIPAGINPKETGFFIMAGNKAKASILENDSLYLRSIDAPNIAVIKGTSWNPDNGDSIDLDPDNLAGDDFKWASAVINDAKSNASYIINAEIKVRENIQAGQALMVYYRAWAELENGEIIREPEDERLGSSWETDSVKSLYAKAKEQAFYEGKSALCEDESGFCYYNEKVFDESDSLSLNEPYTVKVSQAYALSFEISNISGKVYGAENNARFRFKNSEDNGATLSEILQIIDYNFTNANAQASSQANLNSYQIPELQIQQMSENKSISSSLRFKPKKTGYSNFLIQVIAENSIVFEKEISFNVEAADSLSISVNPEFFGAFVTNDFNVIVKNSKEVEQENAVVTVKRTTPDKSETILGVKRTNRLGNARFVVPASSQGTKLLITAEKEGFESAELEKVIDENIVVFNPEELEARLSLKGKTSTESQLSIQSKVPLSLVLSNARIAGGFRGYLDEESMNNFLGQFIDNLNFEPNSSKILTVKTAVSPSALIEEEKKVSGTLHLEFSSLELGRTWAFNVPLKAVINVGEAVEDFGCLNISLKEWKTMTQQNLASKEFTISNNCKVESQDTEVSYLKARLKWNSNPIGNVQIKVLDPKTGNSSVELLRDGDWITLFDKLRPSEENEYPAVITFMPAQGHLNEEAVFKVEFDAFTATDKGLSDVGASNPISAEILITTLTECVKFEPDTDKGIRIKKGENEESFTISTEDCGELPIEFRFCQDSASNSNCRGGTKEGGIEVIPWTTSKIKKSSKEITVQRQSLDGAYGITVEAKVPGRSWYKLADYEIIVEPKESKYFYLDKYKFILLGKGSKDSATLFNKQFKEDVDVTSNLCNWMEAASNSNFSGGNAAGAVISGIGAIIGLASLIPGLTAFAWLLGPLGIIVVIVGIIVSLLGGGGGGGGGKECQEQFLTETLTDFVINLSGTKDKSYERFLPPDAQEIIFDSNGGRIKAEWNHDVRDVLKEGSSEIQTVGINLENLGIESPEPTYGILTVNATEHIHGDTSHSGRAKVKCEEGSFGNYWIDGESQGGCSGAFDTAYKQKFHLRVKTQETRQVLQRVQFDTLDCSTSTLMGRTGSGTLPKIKLEWSWISGKGIDWDSCDAENPNGVYCDATQFSIAFAKRMYLLDEFLRKNQYLAGVCIEGNSDEATQYSQTGESQEDSGSIRESLQNSNKVFIKSIVRESAVYNAGISANKTNIITLIKNNSDKTAVVNLNLAINRLDLNPSGNCNLAGITIQPYAEAMQTCTQSLAPSSYLASAKLSAASGNEASIDLNNTQYLTFMVLEKTQQAYDFETANKCGIGRTTKLVQGKPFIEEFIKAAGGFNNGVNATVDIPDMNALDRMLHFDALLMKDAFSKDFRQDFVNYYMTQGLADAPSFFKNDLQGFKKYFLDYNHLAFSNKYFDSEKIWTAGRYRVDIGADFADDWRLFDTDGSLRADINVTFYLVKEANPNSPFYSLPFDGMIGIEGDSFNRQGYGTQYQNTDDSIIIDNSVNPAKTSPDAGSNSSTLLKTSIETNLKNLNNDLTRRGNMLSLETKNNSEKELEFSSSLATPVIMKITAEKSSEPFKAFYNVLQGNTPVIVGDSLAVWSAGGNCYDFTGIPLIQVFDEKPDRKATQLDNVDGWQNYYGLEWPNVEMPGSTYLRTIFYTPKSTLNYLHAGFPTDSIEFYTADSEGTNVNLGGISTMNRNNATSSIRTLQDIFELVSEGKMCVTSTGTKARFWWNPKTIYDQVGQQRSIGAMGKNLEPGTDCIG